MSSSILNLNYTIKLRSILMKKWLQFITSEKESKKKSRWVCVCVWGGGGTPIHYPYGYVPPNVVVTLFWSCWFRMGYSFQRHFLEQGIIFRTHESSSFVSTHLKLFKDRLLLQMVQCVNKQTFVLSCTLERSIKNWSISRTGFQF